jgi:hypothetical protein
MLLGVGAGGGEDRRLSYAGIADQHDSGAPFADLVHQRLQALDGLVSADEEAVGTH